MAIPQPRFDASMPCRQIPSGAPRDSKDTPGHSKFMLRTRMIFKGKGTTDNQRRKYAVALVKRQLSNVMEDDVAKRAVDASGQFADGKVDKKGLQLIRRQILQHYKQLCGHNTEPVSRIQAAQIAYLSTLLPFAHTHLRSIGEMIPNTLVWAAFEENPLEDWWVVYDRIHDQSLNKMADMIVDFVSPETKESLALGENTAKDDFSDPRFYYKYMTFGKNARSWILLNHRNAADGKTALKALDSFAHCQFKKEISATDVASIVDAAASSVRAIRKMAVHMLMLIGQHFESAQNGLLALLSESDSKIRYTAVCEVAYWIKVRQPKRFLRRFFEKGLKDKSGKIRELASRGCASADIKELIPLIEEVLGREKNAKNRRNLAFDLGLTRDGYVVSECQGQNPRLYFTDCEGFIKGGPELTPADLNPKRLRKLAEKCRDEQENPPPGFIRIEV